MLHIQGLSLTTKRTPGLFYPDWEVPQGAHRLITGDSGCGKTSLLQLLAAMISPDTGSVNISGTDIFSLSTSNRDKFRGQYIGFVFQAPHLLSSLTVAENMQVARYFAGLPKDPQRIKQILSDLGLGHKADTLTYKLSQGEAQRASIARALLNKPKLILADEPTSSLDDKNCAAVLQLLEEQAATYNATLIIATHDQRVKTSIKDQLQLKKTN